MTAWYPLNRKTRRHHLVIGCSLFLALIACSKASEENVDDRVAKVVPEAEAEPRVFFDFDSEGTTDGIQAVTSVALRDLMQLRERVDGSVEKSGTDFFDNLYELRYLPGPIPDQFSTDNEWDIWRARVRDANLPDIVIAPDCGMVGENPYMKYDVNEGVLRYRSPILYGQVENDYNHETCAGSVGLWKNYPFDNSNNMTCVKLAMLDDDTNDPKMIQALKSNGAWESASTSFSYVADTSEISEKYIYSQKSQDRSYFSPQYGFEIEIPMSRDKARDSFSEISCRYVVELRYPFFRESAFLFEGIGQWNTQFFVHAKAIAFYEGDDEFAVVNLTTVTPR